MFNIDKLTLLAWNAARPLGHPG